MQMKKEITFKKTILLIAVLLFGAIGAKATVYKVSATGTNSGTSWTTIAGAYGVIPATPSAGGDTIEIQSEYNPAMETYPITLGAKTGADATHYILIKPANNVKKTIGPANQTVIANVTGSTFTANASATEDVTLTDISSGLFSQITVGSYISGIGTYASNTFKTVTSINSGTNTITAAIGAFTATSTAGKKLFIGPGNTQAILFNGAKYVTIDGVSRTDANTGLTIQNPNCIYAQTIKFAGNAQYNTVQNCIIRGANHSGAWNNGYQGTVYFAGAQYNTIDNNDICDMNDPNIPYPICAIQMTGAGGTNTYQTISNNKIYNVSNQYAGNGTCTFMQFGGDVSAVGHAVLSNKFYWTGSPVFQLNFANFINIGGLGLGHRFEGNTIGYTSAEGTGTTTIELQGTGTTFMALANAKNFTCKNNTVGGMILNSNNASYTASFVGFQLPPHGTGSLPAADDRCNGNQVKDITINCAKSSTFYGIYLTAAPIFDVNIKNNVIKNITLQSSTAAVINTVHGIYTSFGASGTIAVNCIGNEVSNLTAGKSGSSAANLVNAFYAGGCSTIFEKNLIYNLNTISSGTGSLIKGMRFATSNTNGCTIKNNIFRLGTDVSSDVEISAIINEGLSNNSHPFNIYHNSIYIGGTSQAKPSHCLSRSGAISGLISIQNNIFNNVRSGGSAVNQIYNLYAKTDITTSDHNLYEYGSLFGTVTTTNPETYTALPNWISAKTGLETGSVNQANPYFIDPSNNTSPNLQVQTYSSSVAAKGASTTGVTDDYTGLITRASIPALGAYEFTYTSQATDNFKSLTSGNWDAIATWQSSVDNANWAAATSAPTASAASVAIQNAHQVTVAANAAASALTVNGGAKLTLNDGNSLSANSFTLQSDATNGIGPFVDLPVTGGLSRCFGTTTVNQNLSSYRSWYMSSPVAAAQPLGMNRIKYYNEADNSWPVLYNSGVSEGQTAVPYNTNSFETGKGYLVVPDADDTNIQFTGSGNGKLNNGVKEITLKKTVDAAATKSGFNLIGNPYPSYLDWTAVYTANSAVLSDATMWYRTKVETQTPGVYEYKFWTVNGAGVGTPVEATKDIPPMQAFWVRSNANNNVLTLNKDMRSHAPESNKALKAPAAQNADISLVRLQVSNGANTDEAVIYFSANSSDGRDAFDAPKMSNDNVAIPEIYTTLGAEQLVINGMNSIPVNQEIGLGFDAGNATSFSIKANEVRNLPANVKVILKDNVTNVETDITDGVSVYEFAPLANTGTRFSVIFRTAGAVTAVDKQNDGKLMVYSQQKNRITLVNDDLSSVGSVVSVYNAVGQKLLSKQIAGSITMLDGNFNAGVYVVKVNNTSMKVIVK